MAVQSISRAVTLLRILAGRSQTAPLWARDPETGWSLGELAKEAALDKATTHRILKALTEEGLVAREAATRRYRLGMDLFVLGTAVTTRRNLRDHAVAPMRALCKATGDTVFLSIRHGFDAICIDRIEGSYPIKSLPLDIGSRRPMGIGAGSLALLSYESDRFVQEAAGQGLDERAAFGEFNYDKMLALVEETRARSYAINPGDTVPNMSAVGVPILDKNGLVFAALSVAAISPRLPPGRIVEVASLLKKAASSIAQAMDHEVR